MALGVRRWGRGNWMVPDPWGLVIRQGSNGHQGLSIEWGALPNGGAPHAGVEGHVDWSRWVRSIGPGHLLPSHPWDSRAVNPGAGRPLLAGMVTTGSSDPAGTGHLCTPGPCLPGGGAELELDGAHFTWLSQGSPSLAPSDITVVSAKKGSKKVNLEQLF